MPARSEADDQTNPAIAMPHRVASRVAYIDLGSVAAIYPSWEIARHGQMLFRTPTLPVQSGPGVGVARRAKTGRIKTVGAPGVVGRQ